MDNSRPREPSRRVGSDGLEAWAHAVVITDQLSPHDKALLLVIATFDWGNRGNGCTASLQSIADRLNGSRSETCEGMKRLQEARLVTAEPRYRGDGGRDSSCIRIDRKRCLTLAPQSVIETPPVRIVDGGQSLIETDPVHKEGGTPVRIVDTKAVKKKADTPPGGWVGKSAEVWVTIYGGTPPGFGRLGKAFTALVGEHGEGEVLRRWRTYCERTEARFNPTPEKFASTFGKWLPTGHAATGNGSARKTQPTVEEFEAYEREQDKLAVNDQR